MTELVIEALGRSLGSPRSWPGAVWEALDPCDRALLGPVYSPREPLIVPDSLLPKPATFAATITDELDRVAAVSADEFVAELVAEDLLRDAGWRDAARAPRRWIEAYVRAMQRAWTAVAPLWASATPVLEREVERVAVALVRGTVDQILDGLPHAHVAEDRWFHRHGGPPATLADDLVLVPMVTGPQGRLVARIRPPSCPPGRGSAITEVAYALPGAYRLVEPGGANDPSPGLAALVGAPRAGILRRLDEAIPAGTLARQLGLAPSGVTHHLNALQRAGLIYRERVGLRVLVHRTSRGSALLHLYEPP